MTNIGRRDTLFAFHPEFKDGAVTKVSIGKDIIRGDFTKPDGKTEHFRTNSRLATRTLYPSLINTKCRNIPENADHGWIMPFLMNWGPVLLLIIFWLWMIRGMQGGGKQVMAFGRSKAKLQNNKKLR